MCYDLHNSSETNCVITRSLAQLHRMRWTNTARQLFKTHENDSIIILKG